MTTNSITTHDVEKAFLLCAKNLSKKSKIESRKCEDICCGYISGTKCHLWASRKEREKCSGKLIPGKNKSQSIVLVLESPHVAEYQGAFISPALGRTGSNIQRHLRCVLKKAINFINGYDVVLMNSIQYQCSLGDDTKKFRDHMWLYMWFKVGMRKDFINRLKSYNPAIIVNCCTQGNHRNEICVPPHILRTKIDQAYVDYCCGSGNIELPYSPITLQQLVREEVKKAKINAKYFEAHHPCYWLCADKSDFHPV